jgi:hypothetical protein
MALLRMILEKKDILFGKFSLSVENKTKQLAWEEVRLKALSLEICSSARDRDFVRVSALG